MANRAAAARGAIALPMWHAAPETTYRRCVIEGVKAVSEIEKANYVGFPPQSRFLMLPRSPRQAAWAGLALYEAVEPQQRFALAIAGALARFGSFRLLPTSIRAEIDWVWWQSWLNDIAAPLVGRVAHLAFRVPGNPRVSAMLMAKGGEALGFAKIVNTPRPALAAAAGERLDWAPLTAFRAPATLGEGTYCEVYYRMLEPLPAGPHYPPPFQPQRLWAVIDEFRSRLSALAPPHGTPAHYVPCHADLTPRNLRQASDGQWWLFDWDNVRFGPPLADELRYWAAAVAYRRRVNIDRDARRILALLRCRGSDADVAEAVAWPDRVRQTYRAVEPRLHAAVGALVGERW